MIALLAVAIAGCLRSDKVPASPSPLTATDLAQDPAVSAAYPGSTTLDGRPAGSAAEEVKPEQDTGSRTRATQPGYAGQAYRALVAPATRQQIISWYYQRLLHLGWRYHNGGGGGAAARDVLELLRPGATLEVWTDSQIDQVGPPPFGPDPAPGVDLNRLLSTGVQLTAYSIWLEACGRCLLVQPPDHPPAPRTIDLSVACPAPNPPVAVTLSGAATGSATQACGPTSPTARTNFGCDVISHEWTIAPVYLRLVIDGQSVYWTPSTLRIAGPYTSDDRDWAVDPGPSARTPAIIGQTAHVHERLLWYRGQVTGPVAIVDISAPCTSFFF